MATNCPVANVKGSVFNLVNGYVLTIKNNGYFLTIKNNGYFLTIKNNGYFLTIKNNGYFLTIIMATNCPVANVKGSVFNLVNGYVLTIIF
jgi:hypothetical protein